MYVEHCKSTRSCEWGLSISGNGGPHFLTVLMGLHVFYFYRGRREEPAAIDSES